MTPSTAQQPTADIPEPADDTTAPDTLRLVSVLISGLPTELGTPDEPARYTVPAVFSRQVTPGERALIEDPATALRLSRYADTNLALTVSDRRLLIKNTSLTQLRDGLAAALAAALRDIDRNLNAERALASAQAEASDAEERTRAAAVTAAARAVHFD